MDRLADDDDSLDPLLSGGLWERQRGHLTVGELQLALSALSSDLPVELEHYDGSGELIKLDPMHVDLRGIDGVAQAVVIVGH